MVAPAAGGDRRLLERPQARGSSCGCRGSRPGAADRLDEARGQRRDPREVAEQVERRALGGQQRPGRAGDRSATSAGHVVAPLALGDAAVEALGARLRERLRRRVEAEEDPGLLLHDPRPRAGVGGDGRLGGDVAGAEVLGERAGDELAQRPRRRSRASGKTAIVAVKPWRKLRPPTGPISPAQKNPPAGAPSASSSAIASWSGDVEHVRAAAVAGEQQRAGRAARRRAPRPAARSASRRSSSAVAPSRTCMRTVWPTRTRSPSAIEPLVGVGAEDRADEEVAALVLGLVLVDHDAEHQALGGERLLARVELGDRLAQALDRGLRRELLDHVAARGGDRHLGADRASRPARRRGSIADASTAAGDRAAVEHLAVAKQRRRAGGRGAREPAEHRHARAHRVRASRAAPRR